MSRAAGSGESWSLEADAFLTQQLGLEVLRLQGPFSCGSDVHSDPTSRRFVWTKVEADDARTVTELMSSGFRLVVTEVRLERPSSAMPSAQHPEDPVAGIKVRAAEPGDESAVRGIAATAFAEDRFHRDPAIDPRDASRIKEVWAGNFFRGLRGDRMFVAEAPEGSVAGFIQLLDTEDRVLIDLVAVAPFARGRGIGGALVRAATIDSRGSGRGVHVGTQLSNLSSLRLYARAGFVITGASYVLHLHLEPEEGRG